MAGGLLESPYSAHLSEIVEASRPENRRWPTPGIRLRWFTDHQDSLRDQQVASPASRNRRGGETASGHGVKGMWLLVCQLAHVATEHARVVEPQRAHGTLQQIGPTATPFYKRYRNHRSPNSDHQAWKPATRAKIGEGANRLWELRHELIGVCHGRRQRDLADHTPYLNCGQCRQQSVVFVSRIGG